MKSVLTVAAVAALAGLAQADVASATSGIDGVKAWDSTATNNLAPGAPRAGIAVDIALTGIQSFDGLGDPSNTVLLIDVAAAVGLASGSSVTMNGFGYDLTIQTIGASWLSEARMYFDDNVAPDLTGLFLTPGFATGSPGTAAYSSGGITKLADVGIGDIVLPNGILRLEFYEGFDDVADAADANWFGTVTIQATPAPGTLALIGLGGLAAARRRR